MAKKWQNNDSARTMTNKYNETAEEVEQLKQDSTGINEATKLELQTINEELKKKVETKYQLGLEKVDNTADVDKPVSEPQAKAIQLAVEPMVTSEPANEVEGEDTGFITSVSVNGTKLVISI